MTLALDVQHGDATISLREALSQQAQDCLDLGSPLSHRVLLDLAELTAPGAPLFDLFAEFQQVSSSDLVGLRLLAAAHRLALTRAAPDLAAFYPSSSGVVPTDESSRAALRAALARAFARHPQVVLRSLARIPQTNETGRALPLRGALGRVVAAHGRPIRLHELAASAGLNLRADAMAWAQVPMSPSIRIVERAGCDLHPLDVDRAEDRLTLASYIWGDDLGRIERLRTAFVLAHRMPATVRAMSAGAYVTSLAHGDLMPGHALVIWHSAMWFYLDRATRMEIRSGIRKLATRASASSPVVHLSWERQRDAADPTRPFALVGRSWPAAGAWAAWRPGTPVALGTGPAHGMPIRWNEPKPLPSEPLEA